VYSDRDGAVGRGDLDGEAKMDAELDEAIRRNLLIGLEDAYMRFTTAIGYATTGEEREDLNKRAIGIVKQTMDALGYPWEATADDLLERVRGLNITQDEMKREQANDD